MPWAEAAAWNCCSTSISSSSWATWREPQGLSHRSVSVAIRRHRVRERRAVP